MFEYNECNKCKITCGGDLCYFCYETVIVYNQKSSGNKVIDDFIRYTQFNNDNYTESEKMEFVPHDQFEDMELIAKGGFSKVYKATWIDGPVIRFTREPSYDVVLKKLHNSKNITSKELNELKIFYDFFLKARYSDFFFKPKRYCFSSSQAHDDFSDSISNYNVSRYFGITQDPITQDIMFIMPYYKSGDLANYITKDFYNISWERKLNNLTSIINGLNEMHSENIVHRDFHSGNIFLDDENGDVLVIGDFGLSKSATEYANDNNDEIYGVIPYIAPEIFQGQNYTTASDIYSFGMIMWELMTGRRPFLDRDHDTLFIKICNGLRPPIVTNAPDGYIELMKECWDHDPKKRPTATEIHCRIYEMWKNEQKNNENKNPTKITESSDIGPTKNNPGADYKSRPLSRMIQSAMVLRSSSSKSINLETDPLYYYQKNDNRHEYETKETDFDIDFFEIIKS